MPRVVTFPLRASAPTEGGSSREPWSPLECILYENAGPRLSGGVIAHHNIELFIPSFLMVFRLMKNRIYIDGKSYLRLLFLVPAISLVGLAGSSSADARPGQEFQAGLIGRIDTHPNDDERVVVRD
jgi:hypothetical protein